MAKTDSQVPMHRLFERSLEEEKSQAAAEHSTVTTHAALKSFLY